MSMSYLQAAVGCFLSMLHTQRQSLTPSYQSTIVDKQNTLQVILGILKIDPIENTLDISNLFKKYHS